eukprot:3935361-Rhodomonas_salina.1
MALRRVRTEQIRMALPAITTAGEHVVIDVPWPCVLQRQGNALILAYAPLKRHGYRVEWAEGTAKHPHFGGYLYLPDGRCIKLCFDYHLYYLPVHAPTSSGLAKTLKCQPALQLSANSFALLADEDEEPAMPPPTCAPPVLTSLWTSADVETSHLAWCHP